MKAQKLVFIVALLIAAAVALAACGDNGGETPAPITIQQSDGQQLALEQAPQRIVSLSAHATEIFCAIGAGGQLVAVDKFANCPPGSTEKPQLDSFQPNLEAIAAHEPDLVYVFSNQDNIVEALRGIGTPVLYLELPSTLEGVLEQVELFGRLSGQVEEARALVQSMQERLDAVKDRIANVERGPRVFHELDPNYFTIGPDTFI
ncbi:MAG: ABC transporter substrate-binding protein, partial [Dehalococcoidia bacterium]